MVVLVFSTIVRVSFHTYQRGYEYSYRCELLILLYFLYKYKVKNASILLLMHASARYVWLESHLSLGKLEY